MPHPLRAFPHLLPPPQHHLQHLLTKQLTCPSGFWGLPTPPPTTCPLYCILLHIRVTSYHHTATLCSLPTPSFLVFSPLLPPNVDDYLVSFGFVNLLFIRIVFTLRFLAPAHAPPLGQEPQAVDTPVVVCSNTAFPCRDFEPFHTTPHEPLLIWTQMHPE